MKTKKSLTNYKVTRTRISTYKKVDTTEKLAVDIDDVKEQLKQGFSNPSSATGCSTVATLGGAYQTDNGTLLTTEETVEINPAE